MAGTLKLTDIAHSSGAGTITVDSLATLSLTSGKLLVGGIAVDSGNISVNVINTTPVNLATAPEDAMWSGKNKAVFMVDASGGNRVVQLPAPGATGRSTVSIVISVSAINSATTPYTVIINNSSGTEVFTLYAKGDYVEFVSDGTDDFRTGNEHISASGLVYRNVIEEIGASGTELMFSAGEYTVYSDVGGWFDASNYWVNVPYDCSILVQALTTTADTAIQHIAPLIKRLYSSRASTEIIYDPSSATAVPENNIQPNQPTFTWDFGAGDDLEWHVHNNHTTAAYDLSGSATGYYKGAYAKWTVLRRY